MLGVGVVGEETEERGGQGGEARRSLGLRGLGRRVPLGRREEGGGGRLRGGRHGYYLCVACAWSGEETRCAAVRR